MVHSAHPIDRADNNLVEVAVSQHIRFLSQADLDY